MPISGKEMAKKFEKKGFVKLKGRGKGSHMVYRKDTVCATIPFHKELRKGTEQKLEKQLKGLS